jgi:hypothetical protein
VDSATQVLVTWAKTLHTQAPSIKPSAVCLPIESLFHFSNLNARMSVAHFIKPPYCAPTIWCEALG